MLNWIKRAFGVLVAEDVREKQLHDAALALTEQEALVEYHTAMRDMLAQRVARLAGG